MDDGWVDVLLLIGPHWVIVYSLKITSCSGPSSVRVLRLSIEVLPPLLLNLIGYTIFLRECIPLCILPHLFCCDNVCDVTKFLLY